MKKLLFILLFLPLWTAGQTNSTMRFEGGQVWDFGTIKQEGGAVEHTMTFTNSGRIAFSIERVSIDCGCTTSSYTTDPVQPGGKGFITIKFDPKERQGAIEQHVRITSKGGRNKNEITVRGRVIPRPRSIEEDYPFTFDKGLRLSNLSLNFGYVDQGVAKTMSVQYVNTSLLDIKLTAELQPARAWVRISTPPVIKAGSKGEITVTYDLRQTTFYGRYTDRIYLSVNDTRQPMPLSTTFTAVDPAAKADAPAPDAIFAPAFHHHGEVRAGEKLTRTVELANEGTAPLIVRWVYPRAGVSTTLKEGATVPAGQMRTFAVTFNTAGLERGVHTGGLTVITNDPITPVRELRSAAEVQ